jgi:hypothetical protein
MATRRLDDSFSGRAFPPFRPPALDSFSALPFVLRRRPSILYLPDSPTEISTIIFPLVRVAGALLADAVCRGLSRMARWSELLGGNRDRHGVLGDAALPWMGPRFQVTATRLAKIRGSPICRRQVLAIAAPARIPAAL